MVCQTCSLLLLTFSVTQIIAKDEELPSRYSVTYTALPKIAASCCSLTKRLILEQSPDKVNYTFDGWSSFKGRAYLNVYVSFLNKDFEIVNLLLGFKSMMSHNSDTVVQIISNILTEFGLSGKILIFYFYH